MGKDVECHALERSVDEEELTYQSGNHMARFYLTRLYAVGLVGGGLAAAGLYAQGHTSKEVITAGFLTASAIACLSIVPALWYEVCTSRARISFAQHNRVALESSSIDDHIDEI